MTGKELPGHGVYRLHDKLPEDEVLFTERLRGLGYRTALFGKLHVSGRIEEAQRRHPHDGFDVYEYCCEPALDLDSPFNGYGRWLREHHPDYYQKLKTSGRDRGHDPAEVTMNRWAADGAIGFMDRAGGLEGRAALLLHDERVRSPQSLRKLPFGDGTLRR
jgi:arylsulfatase